MCAIFHSARCNWGGVFEDVLESSTESNFWHQEWQISTLRKLSTSGLWKHLKRRFFICGSTLFSKESWRTYLIPDWSLGDYGCQEWHLLTLRKLYTKYQAHKCSGRGDSFILKNIATDFEELDLACTRTAIVNLSISTLLLLEFQ